MTDAIFQVDREATSALVAKISEAVRDHYLSRPTGRDTVCEVMNALAAATAYILAATGNDPEARDFFNRALDLNLKGLAQ